MNNTCVDYTPNSNIPGISIYLGSSLLPLYDDVDIEDVLSSLTQGSSIEDEDTDVSTMREKSVLIKKKQNRKRGRGAGGGSR